MRKKASILFFLRVLKVFLGILNLAVAAKYFGVSLDRDVWLLALSAILVVDLAIWGPINETFRAKFITIREMEGEKIALGKMNSLLVFTFLTSVVLMLVVIFGANIFAQIIAPGYNDFEIARLAKMLIYIAPILLINQLIQIGTSVLNAYDVFFVPEIASFGSTIFNIILTIILAPSYGIFALLIAYYIGVFLLLGLLIYYISKLNKNITKNLFRSKLNTSFIPFLIFAIPFFLPYFFGQASTIIEKSLASKMYVGAISSIDYARKFSEMFNNVLSSVLSTMLIPILALHYSRKEDKQFVIEFEEIFKFGFYAVILVVTVFTIAPNAFVNIIYPSLSKTDSSKIAELVMYYSWSVISVFIYSIFGIALMTHGKSKNYAILGMITQLTIISINFFCYKIIGIVVFPISHFASHLIFGIWMLFNFPIKNNKLLINMLKIVAMLCMVLVFAFLVQRVIFISNPYFQIALVVFSSIVAFVGTLFIFKMDELKYIKGLFKNFR